MTNRPPKLSGVFIRSKNILKLHVSELQLGMYVSKLDCDWIETPFLLQGFVIETLEDIDILAEYCEYVWVDKTIDEWCEKSKPDSLPHSSNPQVKIHKITSPIDTTATHSTFIASRKAAQSMLNDLRMGAALDTEQAKLTVQSCVDSIVADPDTMLFLSRLREKDNYTVEHSFNVCILAIAFGKHLHFNQTELNNIGLCGLLHDVGKTKVPIDALNKVTALTASEWKSIQEHTIHGRDILLAADAIYPGAIDVAYSHHERVDGKGYPRRIKAAGIPYYAKLIAICDAYDAMTADRCYKSSISSTEALKLLHSERDKHFDAKLVNEFMKMIGLFPAGCIVELKNGSVGIVVAKNYRYQHLPKILLILDENKNLISEKILNLADIEKNKIDKSNLINKALVDGNHGIFIKNYMEKGLQLSR